MRALLLRVRREGALAPELLRFEAGRVIERRAGGRKLSARRAAWFRGFFAGLPIAYDPLGVETQYAAARTLAGESGLTVKDAAYLELALRAGAPLATRDRPLREAAKRKGVELLPD
ncbi:MAG: type II toxin-antitoxin system VapC family toxin [Caulobacterales bacterium]|nr:type II toxin-antitoxin system VapC family toxin [Caulobacterales bacterium]